MMSVQLNNPVKYLRGVGPQRAAALEERGIATVGDLLGYLPFRYEDRIRFTKIAEIIPGQVQTILAEVASGGGSTVRFRGGRGPVFHVMVRDASGSLHARFFHGAYLEGRLKEGQRLVLHGKAEFDPYRPGRMEMVNPQIEILSGSGDGAPADSTEVGRIVPVYEAIGAISSRMLRRIIYAVLLNFDGNIPDPLPEEIRARYRFPSRREALLAVHFPEKNEDVERLNTFRSPAHIRLIFEEFFYYQIALALRRSQDHRQRGIAMRVREEKVREALKRILPFKPTAAQKRVLAEIAGDLEKPFPMHRLLEGDVGSGKTIVALEAATIVIENGYQVALMAPTEILAAQHYLSARRMFAPAGYGVDLIVSGRKRAEREEALARIESGETKLVVGTHALIEDPVKFHKLGLAIVDEQHRFGVLQRKRLIEKGASPHVLVMTATPIPRTLALTLYGDLDLSVIDEMPPGRTPIDTRWTADAQLPGVWEFLRREIAQGPAGVCIVSSDRGVEAGAESGDGGIRAPGEKCFPEAARGPAARPAEKRRQRFRDGAIPPRRAPDSGGDHGDRGWRGRAECDRDGDRACRPLRARATAPASRADRARKREIVLHPCGAENNPWRCAGADRDDGGDVERIRDCRARFEAARPGRIFRHAAERRCGVFVCPAVARPRDSGDGAARGVCDCRESGAGRGDCEATGSGEPDVARAVSISVGGIESREARKHGGKEAIRAVILSEAKNLSSFLPRAAPPN